MTLKEVSPLDFVVGNFYEMVDVDTAESVTGKYKCCHPTENNVSIFYLYNSEACDTYSAHIPNQYYRFYNV